MGSRFIPQRGILVGPVFAGVSGGVATGRFDGKMIVLASVKDIEAFPWSADWYQEQVREASGEEFDDTFRLWFMDNADHTPPKNTEANAHIVTYGGEMEQALLDLDAWVADGIAPPASSNFEVGANNQIELAASAADHGGVQPVVGLTVSAGEELRGHHRRCERGGGRRGHGGLLRRPPNFLPARARSCVSNGTSKAGANSRSRPNSMPRRTPSICVKPTHILPLARTSPWSV